MGRVNEKENWSFPFLRYNLNKIKNMSKSYKERIDSALEIARNYGTEDGSSHKMWVIDQMVRELTGCEMETKQVIDHQGDQYQFQGLGKSEEYVKWITQTKAGENGPDTYSWDMGIAP